MAILMIRVRLAIYTLRQLVSLQQEKGELIYLKVMGLMVKSPLGLFLKKMASS